VRHIDAVRGWVVSTCVRGVGWRAIAFPSGGPIHPASFGDGWCGHSRTILAHPYRPRRASTRGQSTNRRSASWLRCTKKSTSAMFRCYPRSGLYRCLISDILWFRVTMSIAPLLYSP
jgi:hypothetical protein